MRLLLDTHIWLWSLLEPERLSRRVARALTSPKNELWLSSISVWEALLLVEKKRIQIDGAPGTWLTDALEVSPLREAPLTQEIALLSRSVVLPHDDPADRFLAATARALELTLVTSDERLLASRSVSTLANR